MFSLPHTRVMFVRCSWWHILHSGTHRQTQSSIPSWWKHTLDLTELFSMFVCVCWSLPPFACIVTLCNYVLFVVSFFVCLLACLFACLFVLSVCLSACFCLPLAPTLIESIRVWEFVCLFACLFVFCVCLFFVVCCLLLFADLSVSLETYYMCECLYLRQSNFNKANQTSRNPKPTENQREQTNKQTNKQQTKQTKRTSKAKRVQATLSHQGGGNINLEKSAQV